MNNIGVSTVKIKIIMEYSFYLPPELWDYIFKFLSIKKMVKLNLISRFFNEIITNNRIFRNKILLFENKMENESLVTQFQWTCENGHLGVCKWLKEAFNLTAKDIRSLSNYALRAACEKGNLEVCKWLVSTFNLTAEDVRSWDNNALRWTCKEGHLEVCKWLVSTFNLTAEDARSWNNYALQLTCNNGHLEVCKWLGGPFNLTGEDARSNNNSALQWACENGYLEVCKWLINTFKLTIKDIKFCGYFKNYEQLMQLEEIKIMNMV